MVGKFPEKDLHLDSLYTEIVILKQNRTSVARTLMTRLP